MGTLVSRSAIQVNRKTKIVSNDIAEQTGEEVAAYLDARFVEASDDAAGIARALTRGSRLKLRLNAVESLGVLPWLRMDVAIGVAGLNRGNR